MIVGYSNELLALYFLGAICSEAISLSENQFVGVSFVRKPSCPMIYFFICLMFFSILEMNNELSRNKVKNTSRKRYLCIKS